jgi:hypothetical protein
MARSVRLQPDRGSRNDALHTDPPIAAQRGGGPGQAPRPNMMDDSDVVLRRPSQTRQT